MKLIFCIDNKRGLSFNGRRQSLDRALRARMQMLAKDARLLMSPYSAGQFDVSDAVISDDSFMNLAGESDFCFVETADVTLDSCDEVILYIWNRDYPADRYFTFDLEALGFKLASIEDFKGYSHDKITEKIYVKEK